MFLVILGYYEVLNTFADFPCFNYALDIRLIINT